MYDIFNIQISAIIRGYEIIILQNSVFVKYILKKVGDGRVPIFRGMGRERTRSIDGKADALAYACTVCGVAPIGDWHEVEPAFAEMMLDWFYSGNWIVDERSENDGM